MPPKIELERSPSPTRADDTEDHKKLCTPTARPIAMGLSALGQRFVDGTVDIQTLDPVAAMLKQHPEKLAEFFSVLFTGAASQYSLGQVLRYLVIKPSRPTKFRPTPPVRLTLHDQLHFLKRCGVDLNKVPIAKDALQIQSNANRPAATFNLLHLAATLTKTPELLFTLLKDNAMDPCQLTSDGLDLLLTLTQSKEVSPPEVAQILTKALQTLQQHRSPDTWRTLLGMLPNKPRYQAASYLAVNGHARMLEAIMNALPDTERARFISTRRPSPQCVQQAAENLLEASVSHMGTQALDHRLFDKNVETATWLAHKWRMLNDDSFQQFLRESSGMPYHTSRFLDTLGRKHLFKTATSLLKMINQELAHHHATIVSAAFNVPATIRFAEFLDRVALGQADFPDIGEVFRIAQARAGIPMTLRALLGHLESQQTNRLPLVLRPYFTWKLRQSTEALRAALLETLSIEQLNNDQQVECLRQGYFTTLQLSETFSGLSVLHVLAFNDSEGHFTKKLLQSIPDLSNELLMAMLSRYASWSSFRTAPTQRIGQPPTENPLHLAARLGHTAFIQTILGQLTTEVYKRSAVNLSANDNAHQRRWTPLHAAVVEGMQDTAEFLIKQGADPNAGSRQSEDVWGLQPIHLAAIRGDIDMLLLLSTRGAKVHYTIPNDGGSLNVIQLAALFGHNEVIARLYDQRSAFEGLEDEFVPNSDDSDTDADEPSPKVKQAAKLFDEGELIHALVLATIQRRLNTVELLLELICDIQPKPIEGGIAHFKDVLLTNVVLEMIECHFDVGRRLHDDYLKNVPGLIGSPEPRIDARDPVRLFIDALIKLGLTMTPEADEEVNIIVECAEKEFSEYGQTPADQAWANDFVRFLKARSQEDEVQRRSR